MLQKKKMQSSENRFHYGIRENLIIVAKSVKIFYNSIVLLFVSLIALISAVDGVTKNTDHLYTVVNIYIWTEATYLILYNCKKCFSKKRLYTALVLILRLMWITNTILGFYYWTNEEDITGTLFYYVCGYLFISNLVFILLGCCLIIMYIVILNYYCTDSTNDIDNINNVIHDRIQTADRQCSINSFISIINETTNLELFSNLIGKGGTTMCSICLENFKNEEQLRVLPCRHYFHNECVDEWFLNKLEMASCPMCRSPLV